MATQRRIIRISVLAASAILLVAIVLVLLWRSRSTSDMPVVSLDDLDQAIEQVRATNPLVKDFDRLFPGSDHWIHTSPEFPQMMIWRSNVVLYDRYSLLLEYHLNSRKLIKYPVNGGIVHIPVPQIILAEFEAIEVEGQMQPYVTTEHAITRAEWLTLVETKGDFDAININLMRDKPIPNFHKLFEQPQQAGNGVEYDRH